MLDFYFTYTGKNQLRLNYFKEYIYKLKPLPTLRFSDFKLTR